MKKVRRAADVAIAPSDKRVIQTLLWALKPLSNLRRSIPSFFVTATNVFTIDESQPLSESTLTKPLPDFTVYLPCFFPVSLVDTLQIASGATKGGLRKWDGIKQKLLI